MERVTEKNIQEFLSGEKTIAHYETNGTWSELKYIAQYPTAEEYIIAFDMHTKNPVGLWAGQLTMHNYYINYTKQDLYEQSLKIYEARIARLKETIEKENAKKE